MTEERKKSLGEFLKSERERRGLTIEQTSSATKIGLKVLKQLEADRYSELPALPFVRGFVRNYGKFLGLDGEKLVAEYATFLEAHAHERPKRDAGHSGYAFEKPEGEQSRKILWGVMAGMLIFGGAVVFLFKPSLKRKHHGHIDKLKPAGTAAEETPAINPNAESSGLPVLLASATPSAPPSNVVPTPSSTSSATAIVPPSPTPSPTVPEKPFVPPKVPLVLAPSPIPEPSPSRAPSPSPTPSPTRAPSPSPLPSPTPTRTPSPSPLPSPVAAATPEAPLGEDDLKKDPLQSGTNYTPKEIHTKIVLRTKADVWVRYRCDEKKLMKFALKKDKILVLRGKNTVYLQVSNPDSITIQPAGQAETLFADSPAAFDFHGNSSVVFPPQAREKMEENFKVGPALPFTDPPPAGE